MINKIGGLARVLYILLAIVAGFVALGSLNVAMISSSVARGRA